MASLDRLPPDLLRAVAAAGGLSSADLCAAREACRHLRDHLPRPPGAPALAADCSPALAAHVLDRCPLRRAPTAADLARFGLLDRLRASVAAAGVAWRKEIGARRVFEAAAAGGRLEVLEWVREEGLPCYGDDAASAAAAGGHLAAMDWLADNFSDGADAHAMAVAAGRGDAAAVRRLRLAHGGRFDPFVARRAALGGRSALVRWLADNGCPLDASVPAAAAAAGDVRLLEELMDDYGCECDARAIQWAAGRGRVEALECLRARGCPWDWRALEAALKTEPGTRFDAAAADWLADAGMLPNTPDDDAGADDARQLRGVPDVCALAVESGAPGAVDWAMARGYRLRRWLMSVARHARGGPAAAEAMLRHLVARGCPWDGDAVMLAVAAAADGPALAEWALGAGWEWRPGAASIALSEGRPALTDWAAQRGLALRDDTMPRLAGLGDAGRVAWALARGAQWEPKMAARAAWAGHAHFLRWAVAQGCPVGADALEALARRGDAATLRWLDSPASGARWAAPDCAPGRRRWSREAVFGATVHPDALRHMMRTGAVAHALDAGVMRNAAVSRRHWDALFLLIGVVTGEGGADEVWPPPPEARGKLAEVMRFLAVEGDVRAMQRALESGCPLCAAAPAFAASNGRLHVLRWLRERGCPFDARVCAELAALGDVRALARERALGCPWDQSASRAAAEAAAAYPEREGALLYVLAAGCPPCEEMWAPAVAKGRTGQLRTLLAALRPGRQELREVERAIVRYAPPGRAAELTAVLLAHAAAMRDAY